MTLRKSQPALQPEELLIDENEDSDDDLVMTATRINTRKPIDDADDLE